MTPPRNRPQGRRMELFWKEKTVAVSAAQPHGPKSPRPALYVYDVQ